MKKVSRSPDEHIKTLPEDVRGDVQKLDSDIAKIMKGETRTLWEGTFWGGSEQNIIGYGDYTYKRPKGKDVEWFIVGLAVQKNYISVYVNAVEGNQYIAEKYADKLGRVEVGKSSISFKRLDDVELDALLDMIRRAKKLMRS